MKINERDSVVNVLKIKLLFMVCTNIGLLQFHQSLKCIGDLQRVETFPHSRLKIILQMHPVLLYFPTFLCKIQTDAIIHHQRK